MPSRNSEEVKADDVVYLKSGSRAMTVDYLNSSNYATCVWFKLEERLQSDFPTITLTKEKL